MKARRVYLRFALRRVESLSPKEQDAIASQIIETLDAEEAGTVASRKILPSCDLWRSKRWKNTAAAKLAP